MKAADLRKRDAQELQKMVAELQKKLQELKFGLQKAKNVKEAQNTKREIARILTVLSQPKQ